MLKWEKPVLSILGINQTNDSTFEDLSGVSAFTGEFVDPEDFEANKVDLDCHRKCRRCHCWPCCCNGSHHGH